jgi:transposase
LESGCTAAWLFAGLQRPVICIDARHAAAALQAGFRNKNDRNDARGIADLIASINIDRSGSSRRRRSNRAAC